MGIINIFLSITGINSLLGTIALLLWEYENEAMYLLAITTLCFTGILFLFFIHFIY